MPLAGPALRVEVGGGITFVTSGENAWQLTKLSFSVCGCLIISLGGSHTCKPWRDSPVSMVIMHVWFIAIRWHLGEIAGKNNVKPLFLLLVFFSV